MFNVLDWDRIGSDAFGKTGEIKVDHCGHPFLRARITLEDAEPRLLQEGWIKGLLAVDLSHCPRYLTSISQVMGFNIFVGLKVK